ncbi:MULTISPECIES: hypothetical protein [Mycobacteriaceae]|uniref:hypothetical protein n=1 Tax=Mycobacteriaceae TaxID=1762 RepID=UPI0008DE9451|nr:MULTISPECIES: hypothetical protein [Mycobacteriaceae]
MAQYIQYSADRPPAEIDPEEQFQQYLEVIGHLLDNLNDPAALERAQQLIGDHLAREEYYGRLCRVHYGTSDPAHRRAS